MSQLELDWEKQYFLYQIKTKANRLLRKKTGKVLCLDSLFKCKNSEGIYYASVSAYADKADKIVKAFTKLTEALGKRAINLDVCTISDIPPPPTPLMKRVEEFQGKIENIVRDTLRETLPKLSPELRKMKNKLLLSGSFIYIDARTVNGTIIYDLSSSGDPVVALPLALLIYKKASEIGSLEAFSLTREANLKVANVKKIGGFVKVILMPSWLTN